jgi:hypothetical protein
MRNQLIQPPPMFLAAKSYPVIAFDNQTCYELLQFLHDEFGTITELELEANAKKMKKPWQPPRQSKLCSCRYTRASHLLCPTSAPCPENRSSTSPTTHTKACGHFDVACHEWRHTVVKVKNLSSFKAHLKTADVEATTGYHCTVNVSHQHMATANASTTNHAHLLAANQAALLDS